MSAGAPCRGSACSSPVALAVACRMRSKTSLFVITERCSVSKRCIPTGAYSAASRTYLTAVSETGRSAKSRVETRAFKTSENCIMYSLIEGKPNNQPTLLTNGL